MTRKECCQKEDTTAYCSPQILVFLSKTEHQSSTSPVHPAPSSPESETQHTTASSSAAFSSLPATSSLLSTTSSHPPSVSSPPSSYPPSSSPSISSSSSILDPLPASTNQQSHSSPTDSQLSGHSLVPHS